MLLVEFNLFNPALDVVVRAEMSLEVTTGGYYKVHTDFIPFRTTPYANWYGDYDMVVCVKVNNIMTWWCYHSVI